VLIVDDDPNMLDFCTSSFALFLDFDGAKIATAVSVGKAVEQLSRSKILGEKFGLVIADIAMPGRTGFDLVNELYDRNFEVEIVLMKEAHEPFDPPAGYRGDTEVLPNQPFVSGVLTKPFHSEALVAEIKKLKFGWGK
jgi:DNA-binding response OmpR family regulator